MTVHAFELNAPSVEKDRQFSLKVHRFHIEVKDNSTEYLDLQEELRKSITVALFYVEQSQFFNVLARPIVGMLAYSKKT